MHNNFFSVVLVALLSVLYLPSLPTTTANWTHDPLELLEQYEGLLGSASACSSKEYSEWFTTLDYKPEWADPFVSYRLCTRSWEKVRDGWLSGCTNPKYNAVVDEDSVQCSEWKSRSLEDSDVARIFLTFDASVVDFDEDEVDAALMSVKEGTACFYLKQETQGQGYGFCSLGEGHKTYNCQSMCITMSDSNEVFEIPVSKVYNQPNVQYYEMKFSQDRPSSAPGDSAAGTMAGDSGAMKSAASFSLAIASALVFAQLLLFCAH